MTVEDVLNANLSGIMNIDYAQGELRSEREAYWAHLRHPKLRKLKRREQNRVNQQISRWMKKFHLDTAEDYHKLACELRDMREGRTKRREGRPRGSEDRAKRRTSQRLADKRRKPAAGNPEEEDTFDSGLDLRFDQVDSVPSSEEAINLGIEVNDSASVISHVNGFPSSFPNEIDGTSGNISSDPFGLSNSTQYSTIPTLWDETWCQSNGLNDHAPISGYFQPGASIIGERWMEPLQQESSQPNSMNLGWQGDLLDFDGLPSLSGIEEWSESNFFVPESHGPAIHSSMDDATKSASSLLDDSVRRQTPLAGWPPGKIDNSTQQKQRPDGAELYMLIDELKSQLHERRRNAIQQRPLSDRQPFAKRDHLNPLIEQCLTQLRKPTTHILHHNKEGGTRPNECRRDVEMRVETLWKALRIEFNCITSSVTSATKI